MNAIFRSIFIIYVFFRTVTVEAETAPFFVQNRGSEAVFMEAASTLANFLKLDCIDSSSKDGIQTYLQTVSNVMVKQVEESLALLRAIQSPMQGNGKCDGSFNSMVRELGYRISRAKASADTHRELRDQAANTAGKFFFEPDSILNGDTDPQCLARFERISGEVTRDSRRVDAVFASLIESLEFEVHRLENFQEANLELARGCGFSDPKLLVLLKRKEVFPGDVHPVLVQAPSSKSEITGIIEDASKRASFNSSKVGPGRTSEFPKSNSQIAEVESNPKRMTNYNSVTEKESTMPPSWQIGAQVSDVPTEISGRETRAIEFVKVESRVTLESQPLESGDTSPGSLIPASKAELLSSTSIAKRASPVFTSAPSIVELSEASEISTADVNIFVIVNRAYRRSELYRISPK